MILNFFVCFTPLCHEVDRIVYYVPKRTMRVIARRATMLAEDRSRGAISVSRFETRTLHTQLQQQYVRENGWYLISSV